MGLLIWHIYDIIYICYIYTIVYIKKKSLSIRYSYIININYLYFIINNLKEKNNVEKQNHSDTEEKYALIRRYQRNFTWSH